MTGVQTCALPISFDDANQLVSSTTDGVTTRYAYDAAGRMVREGSKTYRYGYLDKVMSVTDGDTTRTFTYHADGQLASASYGDGRARTPAAPQTETFQWDGLALIQRGDEQFVNEPHVGGGNPVASSKGTSYFNDALGTTVGSKSNNKYSAAALTAFGEGSDADKAFFTGKPMVEGLGHAFLMRNYRAGLAKWQTADPMGYPDGWNALAYCGNKAICVVDLLGCVEKSLKDIVSQNEEMDRIQGEYVREGWRVERTDEPLTSLQYEVHMEYDAETSTRRWIDGHLYEIYRHFEGVDVYREYGVWATMSRSELLTYLMRVGAAGLLISSIVFTHGISAIVLVTLSAGLLTYDVAESYSFEKARVYLGEYYVLESSHRTITYERRLIE